jgi:hypothetical protein
MWMGGMPPLGYDVKNRKLVVNDEEARIVVDIYRRYLALKSVHALWEELADAGVKSKRRTRPAGVEYGGQKLSRGALYLILQNRLTLRSTPCGRTAGSSPAAIRSVQSANSDLTEYAVPTPPPRNRNGPKRERALTAPKYHGSFLHSIRGMFKRGQSGATRRAGAPGTLKVVAKPRPLR